MSLQFQTKPAQRSYQPPALAVPQARKITAGSAGPRGRGLFATEAIMAGEVIDVACTIELSEADCDAIERSVLDHYYFAHPGNETGGLLVLGLASLCNHDINANATRQCSRDPELGWVLTLIAERDILAGEEVTHRYACGAWFAEA